MKARQITGYRSFAIIAGLIMCIASSTAFAQQPQQPQPPGGQPGPTQPTPQEPGLPQDQPQAPPQTPGQDQQQPGQNQLPQNPAGPQVNVREDYSDEELESFVNANEKVATIQQQTEQKIIGKIQENGLTVDRFNQILQSQQDPNLKDSVNATPEELAAFNAVAQQIVSENQKVREQIETSIQEEGLNLATYEEMMVAYQYSPKVQKRVHKLLDKREKEEQ
jgi:DNA-binding transcriptional MerR regulator